MDEIKFKIKGSKDPLSIRDLNINSIESSYFKPEARYCLVDLKTDSLDNRSIILTYFDGSIKILEFEHYKEANIINNYIRRELNKRCLSS